MLAACIFEPSIYHTSNSSSPIPDGKHSNRKQQQQQQHEKVVAIAGGNMVARIDCSVGKVLSAYVDPEGNLKIFNFNFLIFNFFTMMTTRINIIFLNIFCDYYFYLLLILSIAYLFWIRQPTECKHFIFLIRE